MALKRLHRHLVRDDRTIARLRRELDALRRLRHPSVVGVRDLIHWDGQPTMVMDFIEGEDLKARLLRTGPLPFELSLRIARQLFSALSAAHDAGIVHRDIKPQNIRLAQDGRVYLLDFGSARLDASSQLTSVGTTLGTPEYMAPELFVTPVYDPRVDLYGVGATLYECITGEPPGVADSLAELAYRRANEDLPSVLDRVPNAPEGLAQVVNRCLRRDPNDRFFSASRAAWVLDHPAEERARTYQRHVHPPCLHCHTPLPREAGFCVHCGVERPFGFAPGPYALAITAVDNPLRLAELMAALFPERARPRHILAVAQAGLLAEQAPKLVTDIDGGQARRLAESFEQVGVQTLITKRAPLLERFFRSLVIGAIVTIACAPWLGPMMLALIWANVAAAALILREVADATRPAGLIGDDRSRVPILSSGAATAARAVAASTAAFALFSGFHASPDARLPIFLLASVSVWALLAASIARTWGGRPLPAHLVPRAPFSKRLFLLERRGTAVMPSTQDRQWAGAAMALAAGALVPLEVALLASLPADVSDLSNLTAWTTAFSADPIVVLGIAAALSCGAFAWVVRQKFVLVARARSLFTDAEHMPWIQAGRRVPPVDRDRCLRPAVEPSNTFVEAAIKATTELQSNLPDEEVSELWHLIRRLAQAEDRSPTARRSLAARCILESDQDQHLRFEFLRLAAQLETRAARTWLNQAGFATTTTKAQP